MSATKFGHTLTLEVGLASAPSVAIGSTSWTDISSYVRKWRTGRGRSSELGTFQPGTAMFTLDNRTRVFDPNNAAGPYFGSLLPRKRIRLKVAYNSITYATWCGYVDDWPQSYEVSGHDAWVDVNATDGSVVLNNVTLSESYWFHLVSRNTVVGQPNAWYRLGDQSGTTCTDVTGNGFDGVYSGGATFNTRTGLILKTTDNAIGFDGVDDFATLPSAVTALPYSVAFSMEVPTTGATGRLFTHTSGIGSGISFDVRLSAGNLIAEQIYTDGSIGNLQRRTTTATYNDGLVHHVVVVFNSVASAPTIYVDGAAPASSTAGSSGTTAFPAGGSMLLATDGATPFAVTLDEVLIFDSDIGAIVSDFYLAQSGQTFPNARAVEAIPELLSLVDWPTADETIDTAIDTAGFMWLDALAWPGPTNVMTAIQKAADTDNGQFYMGPDGKAVYRGGHYRYTASASLTSQATFGDSGTELRYAEIVTDGGASFMKNRVRVDPSNYSTQEAFDQTSIDNYLEQVADISIGPMSTVTDTSTYVRGLAEWKVAQLADPVQRVTQLTILPRRDATNLFPQVLGRDIGDRITVKRRPVGGGAANVFTVLIEGINHEVDVHGTWMTTWYLSAADTLPMFILDDAVSGVLDSGLLGF